MQDFAYLRHITLGQYIPRDSVVHLLDPRAKLLAIVALVAAVTANASYAANAILLAALLGLAILSRIDPVYILGGLRPAIPFIIFFAVIQALFFRGPYGPTTDPVTVLAFGPLLVTDAGVRLVVISVVRLIELWLLTSLLTNTTPISTLAAGLESLLLPLSRFGFPAHELSLVFTIALRFLPVFALELEDTLKARIARGVEWHTGRFAIVRNAKQAASLLVPLFAAALRRAEELATAMEARCYVGGRGRTHMLSLHFRSSDVVALALAATFSASLMFARNLFTW